MKHIRGHLRLIVLGHEVTYFVEHKTKIKMRYTEREVICMLEFLYRSITYLSSSKVTFSNKSSELLWEQTVLLSLSIFTFTPTFCMRLSLFKDLSKTNQLHKLKPLISLSGILTMLCQLIIQIFCIHALNMRIFVMLADCGDLDFTKDATIKISYASGLNSILYEFVLWDPVFYCFGRIVDKTAYTTNVGYSQIPASGQLSMKMGGRGCYVFI